MSLEKYKGSEKSFVEYARIAKKRKVEFEFERENYVVSLRRAMNAIDSKYTIYMVKKHSIISEHNYICQNCEQWTLF